MKEGMIEKSAEMQFASRREVNGIIPVVVLRTILVCILCSCTTLHQSGVNVVHTSWR